MCIDCCSKILKGDPCRIAHAIGLLDTYVYLCVNILVGIHEYFPMMDECTSFCRRYGPTRLRAH